MTMAAMSVVVESGKVLVDLDGPIGAAFTLTLTEARELSQALADAMWSAVRLVEDDEG
jgi:hypothetical protein